MRVGIAHHLGWAVAVTASAGHVVVDRRRIELIEPGIPSQPYHHETVRMPPNEAEALVARVRDSVMRTTLGGLSSLRDELLPKYSIVAMTLRIPPMAYVPVTIAEAHASYPVMCRADGMMYHDAVCRAARDLDVGLELNERGGEVARAAERLGMAHEDVDRFLEAAGDSLGPPWRKEHRLAAAAALGALSMRTSVSLRDALASTLNP